MILYSVNYLGSETSYDWSIVTIHKTLEGAEKARNQYIQNQEKNDGKDYEYCIVEIDTDFDSDCIYDCYKIEENYYKDHYRNVNEYDDEEE